MSESSTEPVVVTPVGRIYVSEVAVRCPHCDAKHDGWCDDPRGSVITCDECGEQFAVPMGVEVVFGY